MIRYFILIIIALCLITSVFAQSKRVKHITYDVLRLELDVERTPVNYKPADSTLLFSILNSVKSTEVITIIFARNNKKEILEMGIITPIDTLDLRPDSDDYTYWTDIRTGQEYFVIKEFNKGKIMFSFSPIYFYRKPRLYSIIIKTRNL